MSERQDQTADQPTIGADDFAKHEVLHVAHLVEDMIARHLMEHPAVERNSSWAECADALHAHAWRFYQMIGADLHGSTDDAAE